jgi:hypothetical protein
LACLTSISSSEFSHWQSLTFSQTRFPPNKREILKISDALVDSGLAQAKRAMEFIFARALAQKDRLPTTGANPAGLFFPEAEKLNAKQMEGV